MTNKMNSELKNIISNEYAKVWGEGSHMQTYCVKRAKNAVLMHDGSVIIFDNNSIDKNFYFGYSDCGQGVSYEDNNERIQNINDNLLSYFYRHNLNNIFHSLRKINPNNKYRKPYIVTNYKGSNICVLETYNDYDFNNLAEKPVEMTDDDIAAYNKVIKIERKRFVTRLNSYIKKYGTTKLTVDSYWADL